MPRAERWPRQLLALALLLGCGDDGREAADAGEADAADLCAWPVETTRPGGVVELGTGATSFEPMPEAIQFIRGTQSGTFLIMRVRMKEMDPGNPEDALDPRNPKTRFSATLADGSVVVRCKPSSQGYQASTEEGFFERRSFYSLEFLPFSVGQAAFDTTLTLRVEIIDADGQYAMAEEEVFAAAPEGWNDAGPGDGGPGGDAGVFDAGPSGDAGDDRPDASL